MFRRDSRYMEKLPANSEKGEGTKKPTLFFKILPRTDITESQNHRMVGLEGTPEDHLVQTT